MQVNYKDGDLTSMVTVQYGQSNVYLYDKSATRNKISVVSEKNADKGNRKETAVYKLVCAYCGEEFESYGNKNRKYCCHMCYIKDRFKEDKSE